MTGYSRHLASEFNDYDMQAVDRIRAYQLPQGIVDPSMTNYCTRCPDVDPLFCWAIEDTIFTSLMTPEELATVITLQEAISQGLYINPGA